VSLRRLRISAAALALVLAVAGCATSSYDTQKQVPGGPLRGHEIADSNNDGAYVSAGAITYQLQISRQLNPYGVQDHQYFVGLPKGDTADGLNPHQLWYGVFLWAKNQHHASHDTSGRFEIVDTLGHVYRPVKLNSAINPFAWTSQRLPYNGTEPGEDSAAAQFYENGKLLLFKLNDSIYSNRPLTFYILSPQNKKIGEISLDL
jgi:hypothetical protein